MDLFSSVSSYKAFDNKGKEYNVTKIINPATTMLDLKAYQEYSPLFLPITFALSYGLSFMAITGLQTPSQSRNFYCLLIKF